jgi:hypothetical protein
MRLEDVSIKDAATMLLDIMALDVHSGNDIPINY